VRQLPDDPRYADYESRLRDGHRVPGGVKRDKKPATPVNCHCGKTVIVDGFGHRTGNTCPRHCGRA